MKQTAGARSIAEARADNTAGKSSIRRRVGDGDVNLADVEPTITRVGAGRAEPEQRAGSTAWTSADTLTHTQQQHTTQHIDTTHAAKCWTVLSCECG